MRLRSILLLLCVALPACNDSEGPDDEVYATTLNGANENPPRQTNASGTATFTVNANRTITYDLVYSGIGTSVTGQHLHGPMATDTSNAPVIVALQPGTNQTLTPNSFTGNVGYDSLLVLLRHANGPRVYVNVHSTQFLPGEIRGNLRRQ